MSKALRSVPFFAAFCAQVAVGRPALAQTVASVPYAANNDALRALSTTAAAAVIRGGYTRPGDAPPVLYVASDTPCSMRSGAGDGGSQVPSADSKCWIANFQNGQADLREWGAQSSSSGAYDRGPAIRAAYAWSAASGTPVVVPHGQFWLNSPDPSNLAAIVVNPGGGVSNGFPTPSGQFIGLNSPNHPDNPNTGTTSWFTLGAGLNVPMVFFRKAAAPVLWTDLFLSGNRLQAAQHRRPRQLPGRQALRGRDGGRRLARVRRQLDPPRAHDRPGWVEAV